MHHVTLDSSSNFQPPPPSLSSSRQRRHPKSRRSLPLRALTAPSPSALAQNLWFRSWPRARPPPCPKSRPPHALAPQTQIPLRPPESAAPPPAASPSSTRRQALPLHPQASAERSPYTSRKAAHQRVAPPPAGKRRAPPLRQQKSGAPPPAERRPSISRKSGASLPAEKWRPSSKCCLDLQAC